MLYLLLWFSGSMAIEGIHPLESGLIRRKSRLDRRPGFPIEPALTFYPKYVAELIGKHVKFARIFWRMFWVARDIQRAPDARAYMDVALSPASSDDLDTLEMFRVTQSSRDAAAKARRHVVAHKAEADALAPP